MRRILKLLMQIVLVIRIRWGASQEPLSFVFGQSWPATMSESEAAEPQRGYVTPGTAAYNALTAFDESTTTNILDSTDREFTTLMTHRAKECLANLGRVVATSIGEAFSVAIIQAYEPPSDADPRSPVHASLIHTGRSLQLSLSNGSHFVPEQLGLLASLAVQAGFDFVNYSSYEHIVASVRPDQCAQNVDLVILVDSSGSIRSYFHTELDFVRSVVAYFVIGRNHTRVAVVLFASSATVVFDFNQYDTSEEMLAAIDGIRYTGGGTTTAAAFDRARELFDPSLSHGIRGSNIPKVCLLITDGHSNNAAATIASADVLKELNVNIFSIGAGNVNRFELEAVATQPIRSHVFIIASAGNLEELIDTMASGSCDEPATLPPGPALPDEVEPGALRFFRMVVQGFASIVVRVEHTSTSPSVSVYVSQNHSNPGPFEFEIADESTHQDKVLVIDMSHSAGFASVYISVSGDGFNISSSYTVQLQINVLSSPTTGERDISCSSTSAHILGQINPNRTVVNAAMMEAGLPQYADGAPVPMNVTFALEGNISQAFLRHFWFNDTSREIIYVAMGNCTRNTTAVVQASVTVPGLPEAFTGIARFTVNIYVPPPPPVPVQWMDADVRV
eukprot:m.720803 g.720803  ORF g.720803 m.720803 type:complete len:619 (+) comp23008_c0_seq7:304-2160(+)